jgi:alpha-1,3-mannosyltransferase
MSGRRLRVLHVVKQFEPSSGGLETYVKELATRQAMTHDVTILTLDRVFGHNTGLPEHERIDGLTVVRVPFVGYRRLFLPRVGPAKLRGYDVVHVHAADQLLDIASAISRLSPLRLFMTTHGLFFHTENLALIKKLYLRSVTKWSLSRTEAVFAVSMNDASILEAVGIGSVLLRNPVVPIGDFMCQGQDLLYVGRISANKRIGALIDFMAHVVPKCPSISLHIVGQDNENLWRDLSNAVERHNLRNNVVYHGFLDAAALADLAATCGYTVSASRYEGFGLSVVEGMSVGLLPCMHANAAFEETFRLSGCGLLTDFDDSCAAAQAFLDWMPQVRQSERAKAVEFARAQSWDSVVQAYESHYLADRPSAS